MMVLLNLILHAWLLSAAAVTFATVLVGDGMLLAPVQAWVRAWYRKRTTAQVVKPVSTSMYVTEHHGKELDTQWWWKPLWGCAKCVSGQMALWTYWFIYWPATPQSAYQWLCLGGYWIAFISVTILFSMGLMNFVRWSES